MNGCLNKPFQTNKIVRFGTMPVSEHEILEPIMHPQKVTVWYGHWAGEVTRLIHISQYEHCSYNLSFEVDINL